MVNLIQDVLDMAGYIGDAATAFPTSALLVAVGAVLIAGASLALAYFAAGAVVDSLLPESIGRPPQQRG
ncbi:hypothetical protein [Halorussus halobius]|uniref:hypothetical protein n=1 Tax=Halorussus halobius TaxID=1710537 RepID=UPI0010927826|nr:hypothetical protein [Halorussus halobius]